MLKRTTAAGRLALLGLLMALGTSVGATPGKVSTDGFTYALPVGWQLLDLKNTPYALRVAAGPSGDDAATLAVQDVSSTLPPDRYVQKLLTGLKAAAAQTHVFSQGTFVTRSGLHGCRAVFDEAAPGGSVHFVVCVFSGPGRRKLLVAGLWPASDTAKYETVVEASLKTFAAK